MCVTYAFSPGLIRCRLYRSLYDRAVTACRRGKQKRPPRRRLLDGNKRVDLCVGGQGQLALAADADRRMRNDSQRRRVAVNVRRENC